MPIASINRWGENMCHVYTNPLPLRYDEAKISQCSELPSTCILLGIQRAAPAQQRTLNGRAVIHMRCRLLPQRTQQRVGQMLRTSYWSHNLLWPADRQSKRAMQLLPMVLCAIVTFARAMQTASSCTAAQRNYSNISHENKCGSRIPVACHCVSFSRSLK